MGNASCKNLSEKYYSCCLDKEGLFFFACPIVIVGPYPGPKDFTE